MQCGALIVEIVDWVAAVWTQSRKMFAEHDFALAHMLKTPSNATTAKIGRPSSKPGMAEYVAVLSIVCSVSVPSG